MHVWSIPRHDTHLVSPPGDPTAESRCLDLCNDQQFSHSLIRSSMLFENSPLVVNSNNKNYLALRKSSSISSPD